MLDLLFITGACGSGKSSIVPELKKELPNFDVHDFDEYEIPENPTVDWRKEATKYWVIKAENNCTKGLKTIIAGL